MFDQFANQHRCPDCGKLRHHRTPDFVGMIDAGTLQVDPAIWENLPPEAIQQIVAAFFAGMKGRPAAKDDSSQYAEVGRYLLAAFEVGDVLVHFLTDHAHSLIEVVMGGDA
jgi:hypothetical protein